MKIDPKHFRVPVGQKVRLAHWSTRIKRFYRSPKQYKQRLAADVAELSALQQLLYASNDRAVLLIFQAMDAAGKDGAIGHVLSGVNPQGCEVHSFKAPSAEESAHDFLRRAAVRLPGRGRIGVFNRSYYEEVLIVRVHPGLLGGEGRSDVSGPDKKFWRQRHHSIVEWEKHLHRNGTTIIKFFLHLSKKEQGRRFLARIDEPDKRWKFNLADVAERRCWPKYRRAYEDCLGATSTKSAPWHVVPADDKLNARLIISRIVIEALQRLNLSLPKLSAAHRRELQLARRQLMSQR